MPYVDPTGENPAWSPEPQPSIGLTLFVEDIPAAPEIVPEVVTAAQGGIALIKAGRMDAVLAAANDPATPAEIKWAFEKAQNWERSSPALTYLAQKAGISDTDMDAYFVQAQGIQA